MLLELNFDNIPNYQYVDETFKNLPCDPENKYSVPYTWGTVGIIYNTKYVDEVDLVGWELLWNEKYKDKILMFDNSRDAFGIAQYLLGYSVNTTDQKELEHCAQLLAQQKPLVQQYVMDQIYDLMENEEAWIAPYYAGDYLTMADVEPVSFWQNITDPDNINITANYTIANGTIATQAVDTATADTPILGVIMDREAAGYAVTQMWSEPAINARGGYTTYWDHATLRCFNDFTEKGVVLLLA
jgi:spermidine/putrescine-binding protein